MINHPAKSSIALRSLIAIAALAFAMLLSLAVGQASAGSGGVGTDGTGSGSKTKSAGSGSSAGSDRYSRLWNRTPRSQKRWASRTSRCESGKNPDAIGGGGRYRGAFQFLKSTWRRSPKSPGGDPIDYSYKTQAVVAVKLKQRDGAGHWPVCG